LAAAIKTPLYSMPVPPGARRYQLLDLTPSTSYPALGEPITAADFTMQVIDTIVTSEVTQTTALHAKYDRTNNSIRLYTSSTGAEVATASDQSANKYRLIAFGL